MGCAKTGSGKTAAFALPILQKISMDPYGIFCLVLTPTRELAYQIADQFRVLGKPIGLRDSVIVGGMGKMELTLHVVINSRRRSSGILYHSYRCVLLSPLIKFNIAE